MMDLQIVDTTEDEIERANAVLGQILEALRGEPNGLLAGAGLTMAIGRYAFAHHETLEEAMAAIDQLAADARQQLEFDWPALLELAQGGLH